MHINLVVVAGIRSQFIKVAALQRGLRKWNRNSPVQIHARYINAGQHYDKELAGSIIRELDIRFDYEYSYENLKPINVFANMIVNISETLDYLAQEEGLDWVVVLGDANTTMAGAIAAAKGFYPLIHIEAGIRSKK